MDPRSRCFSACAGVLAAMPVLMPPLFAQGPQVAAPSYGTAFQGVVTLSTDADRLWTYVTVEASQAGKPLKAAFVVQYPAPAPAEVEYHGEASVILNDTALRVDSGDGGWLFKSKSYGGPVPANATVLDVIGIATYWWEEEPMRHYPSSHDAFVQLAGPHADPNAVPQGIPPACNYQECTCAGGAGAQSCTCGGICQVQCYPPYEACCSKTRCWCCNP